MFTKPYSMLFALSFVFIATSSRADISPFYTFDQSPMVQIFGGPALGGASIMRPGRTRVHISMDATSHFAKKRKAGEEILLDFESYRSTVMLRHGLSRQVELGLDLPYVTQKKGAFDDVIDEWHKLFGFPDGGRENAPKNTYRFYYRRDGRDVLRFDKPSEGLGDVRLSMALQLYRGITVPRRSFALRSSIKFPTGDAEQYLGSGSRDYAVAVHFYEKHVDNRHWAWFTSLGLLRLGEAQFLRDQQRQWVRQGNIGFGWYVWPRLILKAQIDLHSPFYKDSGLRQLNALSGQVVFGGTIQVTRKFRLDIGVAEDILVQTVPDVNLHIRLSRDL